MAGKNSFVLQTRLNAVVAKLSDKQAGLLFKSVLNYATNGTVANFEDSAVSIAFEFVRQDIDYTAQKYAETCAKRAESGKMGGRPKAFAGKCFSEKAKKANGFFEKHNDDDNDVDNELLDKSNNNKTPLPPFKEGKVFEIQNITNLGLQCDCITESTQERCQRKATYKINGKCYCNQHSREEISKLKDFDISKRFQKPTVLEIQAYCTERNNGIDAQSFFDFYESKGWKVGNTPMKDWRAAVRTWEKRKQGEQNDGAIDYNRQNADLSKYAKFEAKRKIF